MDFKDIFTFLNIDFKVVLLYICAGLIVKAYLNGDWCIPFTKRAVTTAWKTLIVGTIICTVYVLIDHGGYKTVTRVDMKTLFYTYIFTTSFYELVLRDTVISWIVGLFPQKKSQS